MASMTFKALSCIIATGFIVGGCSASDAQTYDEFVPLVDAFATRLMLADDVALAKWRRKKPVSDPTQEQVVLARVSTKGAQQGLELGETLELMGDQIEANRLVQYELMRQWRHALREPSPNREVDLVKNVRPQLEKLEDDMVSRLVQTRLARRQPQCENELDHAQDLYVEAHYLDRLHQLALSRALVNVCHAEVG